jgi:hypothetical protein
LRFRHLIHQGVEIATSRQIFEPSTAISVFITRSLSARPSHCLQAQDTAISAKRSWQ